MLMGMLKNRRGTAEIVGTVLFLVILFFFFSNVFLWHNQVTREMDGLVGDKMSSAIKIDTAVRSGEPVYAEPDSSPFINETSTNGGWRLPEEDFVFDTGINAQHMELVSVVRLCVLARYIDSGHENVTIYVYDFVLGSYTSTGQNVTGERFPKSKWFNVTLAPASRYMGGGLVEVSFLDAVQVEDVRGQLDVEGMEVTVDYVVLEVGDSGGIDATLSRLWIVDSTGHMYAEFEPMRVPAGSYRDIVFNMTIRETEFSPDGSVRVFPNSQEVVVNYVAPSEETVIFKVITTLGNTAACSYDFSSE